MVTRDEFKYALHNAPFLTYYDKKSQALESLTYEE